MVSKVDCWRCRFKLIQLSL